MRKQSGLALTRRFVHRAAACSLALATALGALGVSCSTSPTEADVPAQPALNDPDNPAEHDTSPRAADSAPAPDSTAAPTPDVVSPIPAPIEPTPAFRLALPSDEAHVRQALPPPAPKRYATFRERSRITVGKSHLRQLDVLPDGKTLLTVSDDEASVRVYDRASKRLLANHAIDGFERFETGSVRAWPEPAAAPLFVAATRSGLELLSATTGQRVALLDGHAARELRWSSDGRLLLANESNLKRQSSTLRFYRREARALSLIGELDFAERVDGWDLSRDNRLLALSHYPSDDLRVIDLHTGEDLLRIPGPNYAGDVAISPDGRYVAVGGQGLLVVDLLNPARRAFYSHLYNNISTVRFSPSGDALGASSYDGRIRLFRLADRAGFLQLELVRELRHSGQANVYEFVFEPDGNGVLSASGDQTIRRFAGNTSGQSDAAGGHFQTLEEWRRSEGAALPSWPEPPLPSTKNGHYYPPALAAQARPSRLKPGKYACKITAIYKMRDCTVKRDSSGHTMLQVHAGNLLELRGVVYDDGPVVRFEGWLTRPSNLLECRGCELQPIYGVLRGGGRNFSGLLTFRNYYDPYVPPELPPSDAKMEEANDRYPFVLQLVKTLPSPRPRGPLTDDDLVIIP